MSERPADLFALVVLLPLTAVGRGEQPSLTHWVESGSPLGHATVQHRMSVELA